jgi:N-acylethanolamine-hydrolysing acid amidase
MNNLKTDCPKFTIHLDYPPDKRWNEVINHFKEHIPKATKIAEDMLGKNAVRLLKPILKIATYSNGIMYREELLSISKQTSIDPGLLLLLQLVYEAFAACTSVIVKTERYPIHIRTMDWNLPILRKLTFQAKFKFKNKTLFTGTSWAGYLGILTGMRHPQTKEEESYSISINYRRTPESYTTPYAEYLRNIYRTLKGYWPVAYLVREVLSYESTYYNAVDCFEKAQLISPTYVSICGQQNIQGAIITRNRDPNEPTYIQHLHTVTNLIQANMDHFHDGKYENQKPYTNDIMDSRYRYSFVSLALNTSQTPTVERLYKIMCMPPCYSRMLTIYTSIMIPYSQSYSTIVKRDTKIYKKAKDEFYKISQYARHF